VVPEAQPVPPPAPPDPPATDLVEAGARERMAGLVNALRQEAGCPPLRWDARAARVAQAHAQRMLERGVVQHQLAGEGTLAARLAAEGIVAHETAQHISGGAEDPATVLDGWSGRTNSRANLLTCRFTHHGLGKAGDRWTHILYGPGPAREPYERRPPE
jgi:uncharacterized protein YkwD